MNEQTINNPVFQPPATYVMMAEMAASRKEFERSARLFRSAAAITTNQPDWVRLNDRAGEMWAKAGHVVENIFDIPHSSDDDEY